MSRAACKAPKAAPLCQREHRGRLNHLAGLAAEDIIAQDYLRRGYHLVHSRWRGKRGELDLIFSNGEGFIIVEVKKAKSFEHAVRQVTPQKMLRIRRTVDEFLLDCPLGALTELRFDVAILDQLGQLQIIENAQ